MKLCTPLLPEQCTDVFVTALEGGSNYWYFLSDQSIEIVNDATPEMHGKPFADRLTQALLIGANVPIHDIEDPTDELGVLSKETIHERTEKLLDEGYEDRVNNVLNEEYDADDADIIFQYWVMGEIVFG